MIDHTSLSVSDWQKSVSFYDVTFQALGYERMMTFEELELAGYGRGKKPSFWISTQGLKAEELGCARGMHIAFSADSREAVDAWYHAALSAGAMGNGAPGLREYHPNYYAAFVIDPDGWRIEACFHGPVD